ncbi:hypothetical protein [Aeoliella mucimassa]|nr:hypothetical protein [Aeoliella mucimassa]
MEHPQPPPVLNSKRPKARRLQYNTATLLGLMALVAVTCVVAGVLPGLLWMGVLFALNLGLICYSSFLVAGALGASGRTRLFAVAALVCLGLSVSSSYRFMPIQLLVEVTLPSRFVRGFAEMLEPLQHMMISVVGGWLALRFEPYWIDKQKTE